MQQEEIKWEETTPVQIIKPELPMLKLFFLYQTLVYWYQFEKKYTTNPMRNHHLQYK